MRDTHSLLVNSALLVMSFCKKLPSRLRRISFFEKYRKCEGGFLQNGIFKRLLAQMKNAAMIQRPNDAITIHLTGSTFTK